VTVIEADGHYVEPFEVQNLFIYWGESYSVLRPTKILPRTTGSLLMWLATSLTP